MGTIEIHTTSKEIRIRSHIVTYGNAADAAVTELMREEIESLWNEPRGQLLLDGDKYHVRFFITGAFAPQIEPEEILGNTDPANNYFRIEEYAWGNISFVDGLGCNTGYFKKENLYAGSTTAAHEYGHTLGLPHPEDIDYRGKGVPGIMYPRGTLVDAAYQYNPAAIAGDNTNGGTMHPKFRRVRWSDILDLRISKRPFRQHMSLLGEFSSLWHPDHASLNA